jgi:hypothetical protein
MGRLMPHNTAFGRFAPHTLNEWDWVHAFPAALAAALRRVFDEPLFHSGVSEISV